MAPRLRLRRSLSSSCCAGEKCSVGPPATWGSEIELGEDTGGYRRFEREIRTRCSSEMFERDFCCFATATDLRGALRSQICPSCGPIWLLWWLVASAAAVLAVLGSFAAVFADLVYWDDVMCYLTMLLARSRPGGQSLCWQSLAFMSTKLVQLFRD